MSSWKDDLFTISTDHYDDPYYKKKKKWESGYNKELDCVIISHDGTLGEIYTVQGLRIGLPKPESTDVIDGSNLSSDEQYFRHTVKPDMKRLKSMVDFRKLSDAAQAKWAEFIEREWTRREEGYWFMSQGEPVYMTGSNYFFLNYHFIDTEANDSGRADFRHSNRIFFYFLEACRVDPRCYGMCYLKNRRSGFSHIAASESVNQATKTRNAHYGILSKTGRDASQLFTEKVVRSNSYLPFFFKPLQAGMDKPKTELVYAIPAEKISKGKLQQASEDDGLADGLDSKITWLNTGSNSYDGFKLKMLVHDESGKWTKPNNVIKNWTVTKTCLRLGRNIIGMVMMGSTSNKLDEGGEEFKQLYENSDLRTTKRNAVGQTPSGMYGFFINALWNMEGFFDIYGWPVIATPEEPVRGVDGGDVDLGSKDFWQAEVEGLKHTPDRQNEYIRQFPLTEAHAFRDEAENSLFNLTKIYDQIEYNDSMVKAGYVTQGNFRWSGRQFDSEVLFEPNNRGRFFLSWIPPKHLQNNLLNKNGGRYPGNESLGAFGCDSYDISGTVGGGGSKGALHGITTYTMDPNIPTSHFFLEYVDRPQTSEMFFNDVVMALTFYGMPMLCENNKPGLLMYMRRHGYRHFSINRPDKNYGKLSVSERELGGIPNSSEAVKQMHASAIEAFVDEHVGYNEEAQIGQMYFNRTLNDWARFDISDRTRFDASISSGLALMAVNKWKYKPTAPREKIKMKLPIGRYSNKGSVSKIK